MGREPEAGVHVDSVLDGHGPGVVGPRFHDLDSALGVTAVNPVVMVVGLAPFSGRVGPGLEVVGADLLTVFLGLKLVKQVPGLLRGFNR